MLRAIDRLDKTDLKVLLKNIKEENMQTLQKSLKDYVGRELIIQQPSHKFLPLQNRINSRKRPNNISHNLLLPNHPRRRLIQNKMLSRLKLNPLIIS